MDLFILTQRKALQHARLCVCHMVISAIVTAVFHLCMSFFESLASRFTT